MSPSATDPTLVPEATPPAAAAPAPRAPSKLRARLILLLKIGLSALLLYVLLRQGMFDGQALRRALTSPSAIALSLLLGIVGISSSGVRWWILLRYEGVHIPLAQALQLTWIGHFFNMVFPGAVSGDAVKMYYVGQAVAADRREEAWTTVLADRVIGMIALVSVATVACLLSLDLVWAQPELRLLLLLMGGLLVASLAGGVLVASGVLTRGWVARTTARLPLGASLGRATAVLERLGRNWQGVLVSFAISFVAHGVSVTNGYVLGRAAGAGDQLGFLQFSTTIPLAMFSNAIPITPGGLGVGETFLGKLFAWSGGSQEDGVTVMLLFRANFYALAALGALCYLAYRRSAPALGVQAAPAGPGTSDGSHCAS